MSFTGTARFQLLDKLGEGGMGLVYEVYDRDRGMRVALKTLRHVDAMSLYFFKREFRALSDLSHPNIVALYELVSDGSDWFLTMEVIDGVDFIEYVRAGRIIGRAKTAPSGTLCDPEIDVLDTEDDEDDEDDDKSTDTGITRTSFVQAQSAQSVVQAQQESIPPEVRPDVGDVLDMPRLEIGLSQLAGALHALHSSGLVHRDLKPSNVRITEHNRLVLMDFGIVAEMRAPRSHALDELTVGTPSFMAPEQIQGLPPSAAADWYAFGVMMYLALSGQLPYKGTREQILAAKQLVDPLPLGDMVSGVPREMEVLCMDLLARQPERRPTSDEVLARLGIADQGAPARGALASDQRLFVGRAAELEQLTRAYAETRAGGTVCLFVHGPSGMGKSTLIDRFTDRFTGRLTDRAGDRSDAGRSGALLLAGRCHERESLVYKAFDGVIDSLSLHLAGIPAAERCTLLPDDAAILTRLFPVLCRVPECSHAGSIDGHGPAALRARAIAVLRELIGKLGERNPVIIRIEDIQWADRESHELLVELLAPPIPARLMVIASLRSDNIDTASKKELGESIRALESVGVYRQMSVGPLSEDEQRELVARMASDHLFAERLNDPMWREFAGHPMLLAELARYAREAPEELAAVRELRLEDVIWRRVSLLPGPARVLVEAVAVAGEPMPLRTLAEAGGLSCVERERAAAALLSAHLLRVARTEEREPWLDTYHDAVREAVCERLPAEQVRARHRSIAGALSGWRSAPPATAARHWLAAGEPLRAAGYVLAAADNAAEVLAIGRAAELYRRVLALIPESSQQPAVERMRCQAWLGLAKGMRITGSDEVDLLAALERAQHIADTYSMVEELATVHYLRGGLLFAHGDLAGCMGAHEKARHFARRAGSAEGEARALSGLGDAQLLSGRIAMAHAYYDSCITLCDQQGLNDLQAATLAMRGTTSMFINELHAGLHDCVNAARAALAARSHHAELVARSGGMILLLAEMGRLDEAEHEVERCTELAERLGNRRFRAHALANKGRILANRGRRDAALEALEPAVEHSRGHGFALTAPLALGLIAQVADDPGIARRALDEGESLLGTGRHSPSFLYFLRDAMEASLLARDGDGVERYAQWLERLTRAERLPWSRFFVARGRALMAHLQGVRSAEHAALLAALREEACRVGFEVAAEGLAAAVLEMG